jgi:hypothetical protein
VASEHSPWTIHVVCPWQCQLPAGAVCARQGEREANDLCYHLRQPEALSDLRFLERSWANCLARLRAPANAEEYVVNICIETSVAYGVSLVALTRGGPAPGAVLMAVARQRSSWQCQPGDSRPLPLAAEASKIARYACAQVMSAFPGSQLLLQRSPCMTGRVSLTTEPPFRFVELFLLTSDMLHGRR